MYKRGFFSVVVMAGLLFSLLVVGATQAATLKTDQQKYSYAIGVQIAGSLQREAMSIDVPALTQAIEDVMTRADIKMSEEEMRSAFMRVQEEQMKKMDVLAEKNIQEGQAFLSSNKSKPGIVELSSGLQYKVLTDGKGKKPAATDTVEVHYRGTLINGEEFDSSYSRGVPATFPVNGVIKGWQEILTMMNQGSKWQVFIPSSLAYGERGAPGGKIGPNATLVFDIELIAIK